MNDMVPPPLACDAAAEPAYEHNGRPVERAAFYAIACDPRRSVAVEACAGAGKTWMLVSRILRALLDGCPAHEILAITFTKKAAGEMRERLHEWLLQLAYAAPDERHKALRERGIEPHRILELDGALRDLHHQMIQQGRPVQIRTFHSWFAALLGTAPMALLQAQGLPTQYELLEDDQQAVQAAWRPFLDAVAANPDLRADYEAVVALHGRSQTHKALENGLSKRVEFALADEQAPVEDSVPHYGKLWPDLAVYPHPADALSGAAAQQRWQTWAQALGAEKGKTPQKAAQAIIDAWLDTGTGAPSPKARLAQLRKALFVSAEDRLSKNLESFPAAQEAEVELQRLLKAAVQHEGWQLQQHMSRLLRCMLTVFADVKRQHGWVDMTDIERTALVMLADPALSGWVQARLDARVRHLLIDEFQDTNPLQWQALHAWLSGYVGAGGGEQAPSVFIVGDPKQSIYRFRRADPQVFIAAQHFVREGLHGDLLSCDHTRRNAPAVIDVVNCAMQAAQNAQEITGYRTHTTESHLQGQLLHLPLLEQPEAHGAASVGMVWRDSLTVARHEIESTQRQHEATQVAAWVRQQLMAGVVPKDIMVLARKRVALKHVQEALLALHIPCVQSEKLNLAECTEVQDIIALLDVLVSPNHDLSLARALKSPIFGCSDDDLTQLALVVRASASPPLSWFDAVQHHMPDAHHWPATRAALLLYQHWLATLPPHDALHAIYHHGDVLARFAAAAPVVQRDAVVANLRALLAAALQQNGGRYLTPYAWVRSMRQAGMRAPAKTHSAAVQLLTIHGAKGLEADCVVLMDTYAKPQPADSMGVLVDWPAQDTAPRLFAFVSSEKNPAPSIVDALTIEQHARHREEINSLYVAMTRARRTLVISAHAPSKLSKSLSWWERLSPWTQAASAIPIVQAGSTADASVPAYSLYEMPQMPRQPVDDDLPHPLTSDSETDQQTSAPTPMPAEPEAGDTLGYQDPESDAAPTAAAQLGTAMHQLLEQSGAALDMHSPIPPWSAARLRQLAHDFGLSMPQAEQAAQLAHTIATGEGAWAWSPEHVLSAFNEVSLCVRGRVMRIDRLVQAHPHSPYSGWWVLDYKSAAQPEKQPELQEQLHRYRRAVQTMYPGSTVVAAFLTGDGRLVRIDRAIVPSVATAPPEPRSQSAHTSHPQPLPQQHTLF